MNNCMNCRNSEKVIDIVLLRVLIFYLATIIILETSTSILLLTRVKNTGTRQGSKLCLQEKESVAPCYPQDMETVY